MWQFALPPCYISRPSGLWNTEVLGPFGLGLLVGGWIWALQACCLTLSCFCCSHCHFESLNQTNYQHCSGPIILCMSLGWHWEYKGVESMLHWCIFCHAFDHVPGAELHYEGKMSTPLFNYVGKINPNSQKSKDYYIFALRLPTQEVWGKNTHSYQFDFSTFET